jgi:hypothetical protein
MVRPSGTNLRAASTYRAHEGKHAPTLAALVVFRAGCLSNEMPALPEFDRADPSMSFARWFS